MRILIDECVDPRVKRLFDHEVKTVHEMGWDSLKDGVLLQCDPGIHMRQTSARLIQIVDETEARLSAITEPESETRPAAGKWSRKEVLGHLIDSASNNHQRFVRAQLDGALSFPGYQQEAWNRAQQYQSEPWANLVRLWASYNRHLAHVIAAIPNEAGLTKCVIGSGASITLEFLVTDYLTHLEHHLQQIRG